MWKFIKWIITATPTIVSFALFNLQWPSSWFVCDNGSPAVTPYLLIVILIFLLSVATKTLLESQEKLRPRLLLSCSPSIDGCRVLTEVRQIHEDGFSPSCSGYNASSSLKGLASGQKALYFRVLVQAKCVGSVDNCIGAVEDIFDEGGESILSEEFKVPFAPSEHDDAYAKRIRDEEPVHLDILYVTSSNEVRPPLGSGTYPNSVKFDDIFRERGQYRIVVRVNGDNTVRSRISLSFRWTGDWQTAKMFK